MCIPLNWFLVYDSFVANWVVSHHHRIHILMDSNHTLVNAERIIQVEKKKKEQNQRKFNLNTRHHSKMLFRISCYLDYASCLIFYIFILLNKNKVIFKASSWVFFSFFSIKCKSNPEPTIIQIKMSLFISKSAPTNDFTLHMSSIH